MTRINLVPVEELMDQHLMAEFREMTRIPKYLQKAVKAYGAQNVLRTRIPKHFVLGTGHVSFFYDKGLFLHKRFEQLKTELLLRGFAVNTAVTYDPTSVHELLGNGEFFKDYTPTAEAIKLSAERLAEKIAMKPQWYRNTRPSVLAA